MSVVMLLQALHVEIEMKTLSFQVTLLVQNSGEKTFPPHYTPPAGLHE